MQPYLYYRIVKLEKDILLANQKIERLTKNKFNFFKFFSHFKEKIDIHMRTRPQEPCGKHSEKNIFNLIKKENYIYLLSNDNECIDVTDEINYVSSNRKIVFLHAYYIEETRYILEMLMKFPNYDIFFTSSVDEILRMPELDFFSDRLIKFKVGNHGRDVFPFLISLQLLNLNKYDSFIKLHSKRSQHLLDEGAWFKNSVNMLVGDYNITNLLLDFLKEEYSHKSVLLGDCTFRISDHYKTNKYWMNELISEDVESSLSSFIPGTMFIGNVNFLSLIKQKNLHLYIIEDEARQLDGCAIHAIERYFGYISEKNEGLCQSLVKFSYENDF